jgi:glycosyltransferase involved in cell wall biosynthesis
VRVLIDYRAALREPSGVGGYAHEIARALLTVGADDGHSRTPIDLTLFSSSWKDRFVPTDELADASIVDRRVPVRVLNFAWHRLQWPAIETLAGGRFDVVHSLHPLLMPARHAAQVITIHDLHFLAHPERTRAEIRRDYPRLVHAHARRADHIVVNSRFTAREVERLLQVPGERISVAWPGRPSWSARTDLPRDGGYLLFVGTLEPRKNIGMLLDAYERIAGRHKSFPPLLLAGRATDAAAPWLERIARAPLAGRVHHAGYVASSARRALYEGACALIHPSFEEGFGMTVLEAMTTGVPVVAAARGAIPEVAGDAALLVDPDDRDALAGAIEQIVDDQMLAARLSAAGIAQSSHFAWDRAAGATIQAYRAAIEHRSTRRGAA